jgi:hypothetical protein
MTVLKFTLFIYLKIHNFSGNEMFLLQYQYEILMAIQCVTNYAFVFYCTTAFYEKNKNKKGALIMNLILIKF